MNYGSDKMACPQCGGVAECESVDVGVGIYLHPDGFSCHCGWIENGPDDWGFITESERPFVPVAPEDIY